MPLAADDAAFVPGEVRMLHVSDTHNLHWSIEDRFPFPDADVFIHTGDFSNNGTDAEIADFAHWLQTLSARFPTIVVIPGNHDWYDIRKQVKRGDLAAADAVAPGFMRRKFEGCCGGSLPSNVRILDHDEITVAGIRIWGSAWSPWNPCRKSDGLGDETQKLLFAAQIHGSGRDEHRFGEIPPGIDVLLTHGPAKLIMDCLGTPGHGWGSSAALLDHIKRAQPRMHLFGHLHEQRGQWCKTEVGFQGSIEYTVHPGDAPFTTSGPPPDDYPCELISCNAMANHPGLEGISSAHIAGPARLIVIKARSPMVSAVPVSPAVAVVEDAEQLGTNPAAIANAAHQLFLSVDSRANVCVHGDAAVFPSLDSGKIWQFLPCPYEDGSVYIVQRSTGRFLDTHGKGVQVWNANGQTVDTVIEGNTSRHAGNLRWRLIPCALQRGTFYIVNTGHGNFLDTHGGLVEVWNNNGKSADEVIRGNTSRWAGNIRWIVKTR